MNLNYFNEGDQLYKRDTFKFRFKGQEAAEITLLTMVDDDIYAFEVEILNELVPVQFSKFSSADWSLYVDLELPRKGSLFEKEEKCLNNAILITSTILDKYIKD